MRAGRESRQRDRARSNRNCRASRMPARAIAIGKRSWTASARELASELAELQQRHRALADRFDSQGNGADRRPESIFRRPPAAIPTAKGIGQLPRTADGRGRALTGAQRTGKPPGRGRRRSQASAVAGASRFRRPVRPRSRHVGRSPAGRRAICAADRVGAGESAQYLVFPPDDAVFARLAGMRTFQGRVGLLDVGSDSPDRSQRRTSRTRRSHRPSRPVRSGLTEHVPLVRRLLGSTWIVESLGEALALVKSGPPELNSFRSAARCSLAMEHSRSVRCSRPAG